MGMLYNSAPPNLPIAPDTYEAGYFSRLNNILTGFFNQVNAVQKLSVAGLNIDLNTLPTEAVVATLRVGDVYRDSTAGNVLKIKV